MPLPGILSRPNLQRLTTLRSRREPDQAWISDLEGYRQVLQGGWSERTCHESFLEPAGPGVPTSRGQCGVSSAWLAEKLEARLVRHVTYCYGDVYSVGQDESIVLGRHCWIEVGRESDSSRLVVDLTGDQSDALRQHEVLHGPHDELQIRLDVDYRARIRLKPSELVDDLVYERLIILKQNLAARAVAR
ncbi:hypothetical protein AB0P21_03825 [Kribbella sp. NPDC056861]|uniref:hypothetical protein n=1 Tax=Kribbella sp. NPDC056861 TaxID=3154857 RepID=UPI0034398A35